MNYTTDFKSIRAEVSPEEWQARVDLAACYRLVDKYGMTDLIYNHITARIPGSKDHLLINLYGMLYKEITASSLVKIDVEGEIIWKPDTDYGINKSGYVIHGAIHKARPDVACVLHTHTRAGIAVSAMKCGLLPLSQTAIRFVGHIGYHDYEGPAVELDERERIVEDLGSHDALIMRNHGLLTCGATSSRRSTPCISSSYRAARRSMPWRRAPSWSCPAKTCSRIPRTSISPARAAPTACWNGRRCCACSRPKTAIPAIRRIGIEIVLGNSACYPGRDDHAARHRARRGRFARHV
jgi:ribulose-5-phosphate 4-epimerase/fuculose-1-phosphate aldolase